MNKQKSRGILLVYCFVFFCFLLMFFFQLPTSDVFIFNHRTDGSMASMMDYTLNYGNGRFLGNLLATLFSYSYALSGVFEAITFTLLVFALNTLLFHNKAVAVIPLAIFLTIPCNGVISECYYIFCVFLNFIVPIVIGLFCLIILRSIRNGSLGAFSKAVLYLLLFVLAFAACLFSENTTILLIVISCLIGASNIYHEKKLRFSTILFFVGLVCGGIVMLLIPIITQSGHKMENYREISSTIPALIDTILGNFVAFTTFFSTFIPLVTLFSVSLIFTARKNFAKGKLCDFVTYIFISYPVLCVASLCVDENPIRLNWLYLMHAVMFIVYLIAVVITLLSIKDKSILRMSLALFSVITLSVAPMMIVNQYGYRTFYTTFITVFVLSVYLLKNYTPKAITEFIHGNVDLRKLTSFVAAPMLVFLSLFLLTQSMYNFAFYSVRADDILNQLQTADTVEVPMLPCHICSGEDEYFNFVSMSIGISLDDVQLIDMYTGNNSDAYIQIAQAPPTTIIKTVLENLDCFDPAYFIDRR